jgi:hypothetical protein
MQTIVAVIALMTLSLFAREEMQRNNAGSWQRAPVLTFLR